MTEKLQATNESGVRLCALLGEWVGSELQRENWDSYGASPVQTRTIHVAMTMAEHIAGVVFEGRLIDRVDPCNNGDIVFSDGDESIWIRVATIKPEDTSDAAYLALDGKS